MPNRCRGALTVALCVLVCTLAYTAHADSEEIPGTRMRVDWPALVARGDVTLSKPPGDSYQGLILGNGDVGVSLFGPPDRLTLHIGKNDLWDYRDAMDAKRPVSHEEFLAKYADPNKPAVANYLFDPNVDAHNVDIRKTYEDPAPSSKPAGQLRFRTRAKPQAPDSKYVANLDLWNAEATASGGADAPSLRTFVAYPRNVICAVFDPGNAAEFDIELARHKDATGNIPDGPIVGADQRDLWVRYRFPADPATYPDGFEYAMVARVMSTVDVRAVPEFAKVTQYVWHRGNVETVESAAVAHVSKASGPVTVMLAIYTTRDDPDPFERARAELEAATKAGLDGLTREHRAWWRDYWRRSFVFLDGKHDTLNHDWFFNQYLLACAFRPGKVAPGLFGAWAWEDFPWFGNDYHWDYNMQQAVWGAFSGNHLEQVVPYEDAALSLLPAATADARETYGIDGAKFFLTSYPRKYRHNPFPLLHYDKMMSLNGWVAHPLWWKYLYTQDREYLRTRAYPLMREAAKFYAAYATRDADGKYDIAPTAAWDVDFTPHLKFNRSFPMDLSFAKYLLRSSVQASEILNVDADLRARWTVVADHLRAYPMDAKHPGGPVFTAYEGSTANYHFPLATMMIFPGDDVGLHSPADVRETALRTLAPMTYSGDEHLLKAVQRVRMGVDDMDAWERQLASTTRANGTISYPGQPSFWIHGCGNTLWASESILQSYTGVIRVAPVKRNVTARFANLRAVGAFLVSGEIRGGGEIAYLSIESERGGRCRLMTPWDGEVRIRELPSLQFAWAESKEGVVAFDTIAGKRYILDRPFQPWEQMPNSAVP
jgi:hypothetical protein